MTITWLQLVGFIKIYLKIIFVVVLCTCNPFLIAVFVYFIIQTKMFSQGNKSHMGQVLVVHTCNPKTQETGGGWDRAEGWFGLPSKTYPLKKGRKERRKEKKARKERGGRRKERRREGAGKKGRGRKGGRQENKEKIPTKWKLISNQENLRSMFCANS